MLEKLKQWCVNNQLCLNVIDEEKQIVEIIGFGKCLILREKIDSGDGATKNLIIWNDFELLLDDDELLLSGDVQYYIFDFGGNFYYQEIKTHKLEKLNLLKYVGESDYELKDLEFIPLGIHGKYEVLNGSRNYRDWIKKAKFYGFKSLGICELNTLAGTLPFQLTCRKQKIQSILGASYIIKTKEDNFTCKLYVENEKGWENLLYLNTIVNVKNTEFKLIEEEELLSHSEGLIFVFATGTKLSQSRYQLYSRAVFTKIFYQIDSIVYDSKETDLGYLNLLKEYFNDYLDLIDPILINDCYYLDKEHYTIKPLLNRMKGTKFGLSTKTQYFKNLDENGRVFGELFRTDDGRFEVILEKAINNTKYVQDICKFQITTGQFKLPKFKLSKLPESYFPVLLENDIHTNQDFFQYLINKGLGERITKNSLSFIQIKEWKDRIGEEREVIEMGGFVDYFLILWDVCRYCRENNILIGMGRGSGGGSLIAYLLGLTHTNPMQFDLLFSRFLNKGRIKKSLPDLDTDVMGERREEVKKYIETLYGQESVCSIGTYLSLQIRQAFKDLTHLKGVPFSISNFLSQHLEETTGDWEDIFRTGLKKNVWYNFIQENGELINMLPLCLNQPKSTSIHACAIIILPEEINGVKKTIYQQIPVRKEGEILVSEWEGEDLADAGYLKEDLLGLKQLDKFGQILDLIKETTGEDIDIYNLPVDDQNVMDLFRKGFNSDVFHLGSNLLKAYSIDVKPDTIEDLIAMLALVRPGALLSGANHKYVKLKEGIETPEYDWGCEEITKSTYGLLIYQEQVMKICNVIGGFDLVKGDDIRRAMGHLDMELLKSFEEDFIDGALKNGCPIEEANKLWNKMVGFAKYAFNRSHSTSYALTGYVCQWLKYYYPLQFWTVALQYADTKKLDNFISEINKLPNKINLKPVDINKSMDNFIPDFKTNSIYWSLNKIDYLGEIASSNILEERDKNGLFFSFQDFINRVIKSKVRKNVVENLILAGAFDEVENIQTPVERINVLEQYYEFIKAKDKDINKKFIEGNITEEYWWILQQKLVSGLGYFNYDKIILKTELNHLINLYCDEIQFFGIRSEGKRVLIAGILEEVKEKSSKKGKFGSLVLDFNSEKINIMFWAKLWDEQGHRDNFKDKIGQILFISGRVAYSDFYKCNILQTEDDIEYTFIK